LNRGRHPLSGDQGGMSRVAKKINRLQSQRPDGRLIKQHRINGRPLHHSKMSAEIPTRPHLSGREVPRKPWRRMDQGMAHHGEPAVIMQVAAPPVGGPVMLRETQQVAGGNLTRSAGLDFDWALGLMQQLRLARSAVEAGELELHKVAQSKGVLRSQLAQLSQDALNPLSAPHLQQTEERLQDLHAKSQNLHSRMVRRRTDLSDGFGKLIEAMRMDWMGLVPMQVAAQRRQEEDLKTHLFEQQQRHQVLEQQQQQQQQQQQLQMQMQMEQQQLQMQQIHGMHAPQAQFQQQPMHVAAGLVPEQQMHMMGAAVQAPHSYTPVAPGLASQPVMHEYHSQPDGSAAAYPAY